MIHVFLVIFFIVGICSSGQSPVSTRDTSESQSEDKQISPYLEDRIPIEPPDIQLPPPEFFCPPDSPFKTHIPLENVIE